VTRQSRLPEPTDIRAVRSDEDNVEVYRFEVWDRAQRKNIAAPYMATPATIRRMKGEADLSSKQIVEKAALDGRGFYCSDAVPS
jgi:hypothetical protein